MKIYWLVSFRNVKRHWRQSLAAVLTISIGFAAMVLFEGYIQNTLHQLFVEYRELMMFGDVNIEKKGLWSPEGRAEPMKFGIDEKHQQEIAEVLQGFPEVAAWSKFLRIGGMGSTGHKSAVFWGIGYDLESGVKIRGQSWAWNSLYGTPLENSRKDSIVLGQTLAQKLGCLPDPAVEIFRSMHGYTQSIRPFKCHPSSNIQLTSMTASGQISALDLEVVGLVDAGFRDLDSRFLMTSLENAQSLAGTRDISYVSVLLKNPNFTKSFVEKLQKISDERGLNLTVQDWRQHKVIGDTYSKSEDFLLVFKNSLSLILLGIAWLSVLNTMVRIVKERTREIGIWRSLGYTDRQLSLIFAAEAFLLGLIGSGIGTMVSAVLTLLINSLHITYRAGLFSEPIPFAIAWVSTNFVWSALILCAACIIASAWATRGILKKRIYENMTN